jgi:hypothetical protein
MCESAALGSLVPSRKNFGPSIVPRSHHSNPTVLSSASRCMRFLTHSGNTEGLAKISLSAFTIEVPTTTLPLHCAARTGA